MFIELHILQNFAPSNLNRDDTGNPKDTEFGGVRRARVSSQAIKRAMREHPVFAKTTEVETGVRTRWLAREIAEKLEKAGKSKEDSEKLAIAFIQQLLGDMDKKAPTRSNVLAYVDEDEIRNAVNALAKEGETAIPDLIKKTVKSMAEFTSAPDVALFGRMLARKPSTVKLDAACQVAHAISTHRVNMELDYFTAVDDLQKDDETGASMIGVTAFNSACFYRYARIDWGLLVKNLNGDKDLACKTVEGFLRAAALAIPSGKQNAFGAQNPPDFMLGVVRKDGQSWSLANAFETPVRPNSDGGLMATSIKRLNEYWAKLSKVYGSDGITTAVLSLDGDNNMDGWVGKLLGSLE